MDHTDTAGRWGKVSAAVKRGPAGRSKLYDLARKHPGLFRKLDGMTVVDLVRYDEILSAAPPADLKEPE
jgi:hypothetical protein